MDDTTRAKSVRLIASLLVGLLFVVLLTQADARERHHLLWVVLPLVLCLCILRALRARLIKAGHWFSETWEIILFFLFLWSYLTFFHFRHKIGM